MLMMTMTNKKKKEKKKNKQSNRDSVKPVERRAKPGTPI